MTITTPQNGVPVAACADSQAVKPPPADPPKLTAGSALKYSLLVVALALCDYPSQPRSHAAEAHVAGLWQSIEAHGQQVPIVGYWFGSRFVVADGGCRIEALKLGGRTEILAMDVGREMKRLEVMMAQAAIDLHDAPLPPVDSARLLSAIREEKNCTWKEVSQIVGIAESALCKRIKLLKLCPEVAAMVNDGRLPESKGAIIADATDDPSKQREMAASPLSRDELAATVGKKRKAPVASEEKVKKFRLEGRGLTAVFTGKKAGISDLVAVLASWHQAAKAAAAAGQSITTLALIVADADKAKPEAEKKGVA